MKRVWSPFFRQCGFSVMMFAWNINKCAALVLKRRKTKKFDGISLPDGRFTKRLLKEQVINIWVYYKPVRLYTRK